MARPGYYPDVTSFESGRTFVDLAWTSGSSGAVPAALSRGSQIKSVVHGATGVFVVTFVESWANGLLDFSKHTRQASYSASGACNIEMTANALTNATTPTVTLLVTNAAGAAVEPTTGDILACTFVLQANKN